MMNPMALAKLELSLLLPFFVLSLITLIIFKRSSIKGPPLPPCPYGLPLLGNIFQMGKIPHVTLANLAKVHGPLLSLRFGTRLLIVGSSPAAAAEILKTHDRMLSGRHVLNPLKVKGSKLHNLALVFSDESDDGWKNLRTLYRDELFSAKAIQAKEKLREKKVMEMVDYLTSSKIGQMVEIKEMAFVTTLNILSNILFSKDFIDFEGKGVGKELREYTSRFSEWGATQNFFDLYPIFGVGKFQSMYKKFQVIYEGMCGAWEDIVNERRKGRIDPLSQRDFTDALIGKGFTNEQINPLFQELFNAGTNSQVATIEWTLVELIKNKEAMHKLRGELEKLVDGDTVRESNLPHLPYLEACFKETLRLHPPGPLLIPHRAMQTCEVMGYTIPKDSEMLVNMWAIGRDSTIWDDPLSFKPERFLVSGLDYKGQDFQYIPFSSGRRMCPGHPLVSVVVRLIIASLIHNFEWSLPDNMDPAQIDMDEIFDITMQKKEPLCLIPKLRKL